MTAPAGGASSSTTRMPRLPPGPRRSQSPSWQCHHLGYHRWCEVHEGSVTGYRLIGFPSLIARARAAYVGADADHELFRRERLDDVIVEAALKALSLTFASEKPLSARIGRSAVSGRPRNSFHKSIPEASASCRSSRITDGTRAATFPPEVFRVVHPARRRTSVPSTANANAEAILGSSSTRITLISFSPPCSQGCPRDRVSASSLSRTSRRRRGETGLVAATAMTMAASRLPRNPTNLHQTRPAPATPHRAGSCQHLQPRPTAP